MIKETITYECTLCQSLDIVKMVTPNKVNKSFHCHACGAFGTLNPTVKYSPKRKEEILRAYQERSSLRGLERTFGVSRQTVSKWLKQKAEHLPPLGTYTGGE